MVPAVPNQALGSGFPFSQCVRPTSAKHGSSCVDAPGQGSMIQLLARLIHDRPPHAGDSAACMFHHQTPLPLATYAPKLADQMIAVPLNKIFTYSVPVILYLVSPWWDFGYMAGIFDELLQARANAPEVFLCRQMCGCTAFTLGIRLVTWREFGLLIWY